jgi:hypothetical protein
MLVQLIAPAVEFYLMQPLLVPWRRRTLVGADGEI